MTADEILAKLTLEQKICQMIQPAVYNINTDLMAEYDFGSVLSKTDGLYLGGSEWKSLIRDYQRAALSSEAGVPFIYGQDDVHGVNYCRGAVLFPHNIGLGAANDGDRDAKLEDFAFIMEKCSRRCFGPVVFSIVSLRYYIYNNSRQICSYRV